MSVTTTSTASVLQELGVGDHKVCFSATSDDFSSRMVRFDSECILIPDRELRRPKMTKVYSLPLWKRRTSVSPGREVEVVESGVSPTTEERVLFKVPIPRFISRSPSRGRTPSSSPPMKAPSPILVHRMPSSLPHPTIPRPLRRSSLPVDYSNTHKPNTDEVTIPLRECCAACEAVTDECLQEGEHWHEKFTRAARRRRSASLDNPNLPDIDGSSKYSFAGAISDPVPTNNSRFGAPTFALTVDEVDKRRKSLDAVESELIRHSSSSSTGESGSSSSPSATSSSINTPGEPSSIQPHRPKASPIEEEDEDQLFPLPSPRRSPASTPSVSPRNSPLPSPSASTSCLSPYRASRESLLRTWTTAEEDIIAHSLSRTPNLSLQIPSNSEKGNNKPSGLALSIPKEGSTSSTSSTDSNSSTKPTSPIKPALAPLVITASASTTTTKVVQSIPKPAVSPRSANFEPSSSPRTAKSRPVAVPTTPKKTTDRESSPDHVAASNSPLSKSPSHRRRGSLSIPGIGGAIKGAGLGVLRGVTSFGTGGGTMV